MQPLFILPPAIAPAEYLSTEEARKIAGMRLTSPPAAWTDEILQTLVRDHPYLPLDRLIVNFKQRDDALGYASGYVGILGDPKISIPVIIAKTELKPLDVLIVSNSTQGQAAGEGTGAMTDDQVMPLTEANFTHALESSDVGECVRDVDTRGTAYTEDGSAMRLPMRGRTVLASFLGATEAQKKAMLDVVTKEAFAGFNLNDTSDVVDAWLQAAAPRKTFEGKIAAAAVEPGVAKLIHEDDMPAVGKTAEGIYDVFLENGEAKTAVAFSAISLHAPENPPENMLLFADGSYCTAPEQLVTAKTASTIGDVVSPFMTASLRRGTEVMFFVDGAITAPAKIANIGVAPDSSITVFLHDTFGSEARVTLTPAIKEATRVAPGEWVFPADARILLASQYATTKVAKADQLGRLLESMVPDQLISANGQYSLKTAAVSFNQLPREKAADVLGAWFTNADQIMKVADASGLARFDAQISDTAKKVAALKGFAAQLPQFAAEKVAQIRGDLTMAKLVKLAATIGNADGADAILGLGFLNEDNLSEFTQLVSQFESTVSGLARLLLAIRMGYPGDENATAVAMKALQRVADRLKSVSAEVGEG